MGKDGDPAREAAGGGEVRLSRASVGRLSLYLRRVEGLAREGVTKVSSGQLGEAQTRRAVEVIVRNVNAQIRLVDDLLDMSEIVNGRMRLVVRPVDLHDLIEDAPPVQVGQANHVRIEGRIVSVSPFVVSLEGLPITITVPSGSPKALAMELCGSSSKNDRRTTSRCSGESSRIAITTRCSSSRADAVC